MIIPVFYSNVEQFGIRVCSGNALQFGLGAHAVVLLRESMARDLLRELYSNEDI